MVDLTDKQKRLLWRQHHEEHAQAFDAWWANAMACNSTAFRQTSVSVLPKFPEVLRGLTCGARTRSVTPCRMRSLCLKGRCNLHGGMSTGPITTEGKARSALNGYAPKKLTPREVEES